MSLVISDQDISEVEDLLGLRFDAESRAVIRCLESKDVQACPGAGKTTVLVAKLLILEKKLSTLDGRGICILTHTNVAIDEIREKAGAGSPLFQHPNFCGTIQSFVDRFLAIPAYVHLYKRRPTYIDSDVYDRRMARDYYQRYGGGARIFGGGPKKTKEEEAELWQTIRARTVDGRTVYKFGMGPKTFASDPTTARYQAIYAAKSTLLEDGILHFDDAFILAENYLLMFPQLIPLFEQRFAFVFMDEMQDTAQHQEAILNQLFEGRTIVQRLGDQNQRIFDSGVGWQPKDGFLTLSHSKRMSSTISARVRHVCKDPHDELGGHERSAHKPVAFLFDDADVEQVLSAFGKLICDCGLADSNRPFKAVGRVGVRHSKRMHTLPNYHPSFGKPNAVGGRFRNSLHAHLTVAQTANTKVYRTVILEALRGVLYAAQKRAANGGYYSIRHMLNYLNTTAPDILLDLQVRLVYWCRALYDGTDIFGEMRDYIYNTLLPLFEVTVTSESIERYLAQPEGLAGRAVAPGRGSIDNVFHFRPTPDHTGVKIDIATVHSVKGETHAATLYLETYYRQYDIGCLLPRISRAGAQVPESFLPVAYVAMTRPTDLLCIALHKSSCDGASRGATSKDIESLLNAGWEVVDVAEWKS